MGQTFVLGRTTLVLALALALATGCGESRIPVGPNTEDCDTRVLLARGNGRSLTPAEIQCFELEASASYALAWFDATSLERARTGPEVLMADEAGYSISLSSGSSPAASMRLSRETFSNAGFLSLPPADVLSMSADCT